MRHELSLALSLCNRKGGMRDWLKLFGDGDVGNAGECGMLDRVLAQSR